MAIEPNSRLDNGSFLYKFNLSSVSDITNCIHDKVKRTLAKIQQYKFQQQNPATICRLVFVLGASPCITWLFWNIEKDEHPSLVISYSYQPMDYF